ncbi:helix-turn-helix domain-containing protein [Rubritepida flocculans]|uniref:helix-turn-helix domain-containing protein n=1 Tax=Rubritepida flocculans TaxID=182403 RepID=UPI00146A028A|nr:helix-turn-helix domain-containing protein [Rubritepida flocculans]
MKSAARVLQILEFFDAVRRPVEAWEVAAALGYPQSSTRALLRSLTSLGYLTRDVARRRYAPTLRVPLLGGGWIAPELCGMPPLRLLIDSVAQRTGGCVAVMARNGDRAEAIVATSAWLGALGGRREWMIEGASGRCLLIDCDDSQIRRLLHRWNAEAAASKMPRVDPSSFLHDVAILRRRGWIALPDPKDEQRAHVTMPLTASDCGGLLALTLSVPAPGLGARVSALAAAMREECEVWLRREPPITATGRGRIPRPLPRVALQQDRAFVRQKVT